MSAIALILGLLGFPLGDDGSTIDALKELERFEAGFDQAGIEASLLKHASSRGLLPLAAVAAQGKGPGVPEVTAAKAAPDIRPLAELELGTLQDVHALGEGASLDLAAPEVEALAAALAWRLSRQTNAGPYTLESVELIAAQASMADVATEAEIGTARMAALEARPAFEQATQAHTKAEELHLREPREVALIRLRWLKGKIAFAKGEDSEAEEAFLAIRDYFLERQIAHEVANVGLDLSLIYLRSGRWQEARDTATMMLEIYRSKRIQREAIAALALFQKAVTSETATLELVSRLKLFLEEAVTGPGTHFEPTGSRF